MTTIVAVRKNGYAAIAADTLTTLGNRKESAGYIDNCEKIFKYKNSFLAVTGWATFQLSLQDFLVKTRRKIILDSVENIFSAWQVIHKELKENYHLQTERDSSDSFETTQADILIANQNGIFGVSEYRYVQKYSKFYACGSGGDYALGAMLAIYEDENKSAEEIARIGINAGAEFDDGTSLPMNCYTVKLK